MHNMIYLIGRLTNKELKMENDKVMINVAVTRAFKNENGEYETDFIDCTLIGNIAINSLEYLSCGDLVGIKGRLENHDNKLTVQVDKISFLASKKN